MQIAGVDLDTAEYVGDEPMWGMPTRREKAARLSLRAFYGLTAALSLWIFAYGSGLFPYLGWAELEDNSAPPFGGEPGYSMGFGTSTMLLFEGQTAFYDYKSTSAESDITFDVKPLTVLGYSPAMQRVTGVAEGRIEIPIKKTGLYKFRQGPAIGRRYGTTAYEVTWGAR